MRLPGIEPGSPRWQRSVLPINYNRLDVGNIGAFYTYSSLICDFYYYLRQQLTSKSQGLKGIKSSQLPMKSLQNLKDERDDLLRSAVLTRYNLPEAGIHHLNLYAPPGAGKGTLAKNLGFLFPEYYGHLESSLALKEHFARLPPEVVAEYRAIMRKGGILPDEPSITAYTSKRDELHARHPGRIDDGFPRSDGQALYLANLLDERKPYLYDIVTMLTVRDPLRISVIRQLERAFKDVLNGKEYRDDTDEASKRVTQFIDNHRYVGALLPHLGKHTFTLSTDSSPSVTAYNFCRAALSDLGAHDCTYDFNVIQQLAELDQTIEVTEDHIRHEAAINHPQRKLLEALLDRIEKLQETNHSCTVEESIIKGISLTIPSRYQCSCFRSY